AGPAARSRRSPGPRRAACRAAAAPGRSARRPKVLSTDISQMDGVHPRRWTGILPLRRRRQGFPAVVTPPWRLFEPEGDVTPDLGRSRTSGPPVGGDRQGPPRPTPAGRPIGSPGPGVGGTRTSGGSVEARLVTGPVGGGPSARGLRDDDQAAWHGHGPGGGPTSSRTPRCARGCAARPAGRQSWRSPARGRHSAGRRARPPQRPAGATPPSSSAARDTGAPAGGSAGARLIGPRPGIAAAAPDRRIEGGAEITLLRAIASVGEREGGDVYLPAGVRQQAGHVAEPLGIPGSGDPLRVHARGVFASLALDLDVVDLDEVVEIGSCDVEYPRGLRHVSVRPLERVPDHPGLAL